MKRILAILLVVIMILPMCLVAQADGASTDVLPFTFINWNDPGKKYDNVREMPYFWLYFADYVSETLDIKYPGGGGADIPSIAKGLKETFDKYPEGSRFINFPMVIEVKAENVIFLEKGPRMVQKWLEEFLAEYKRIGGKLDGLVCDVEYLDGFSPYLSNALSKDPLLLNKIVEDPRYKTEVRPLLEERGFKFWPNPTEYCPEIYSIHKKAGDDYVASQNIWDAVMRNRLSAYITKACEPLFKYYPDAMVNNYCYGAQKTWLKTHGDRGDLSVGGNYDHAGNTSNENTYFIRPGQDFYTNLNTSEPTLNKPVNYNDVQYKPTQFNMLLWDMHVFKNMYEASGNERISAWIAPYCYNDEEMSTCNSPYYAETLFHIGLMNPQPFIGYIVKREFEDKYQMAMKIVDDIMTELTRVAGVADRKYIYTPHDWNASFALTGMYAGGRNVWRLTPDLSEGMTLEKFKVEGSDPTFYINGQTVTFPGGKIIETGEVTEIGTCGYWIETPENVMPVVTSDVDRYSKFPAYGLDFEECEVGAEYKYEDAKPVTSWEMKKGKNTSVVIQADKDNADNKVLAITGTYAMKNLRVTEKITAGDTYAENQAWEVTVTIPANMAADAEIQVLDIYDTNGRMADGGFKVAGGKLYHDNAGEYVEVAGVDVSAGGKFTLKRDMDFHTKDAYTTDYYVYDAAGKLIALAKDVPMASGVKIPVKSVGLSCTNVVGDPVLLDDYKLYATGVATDFELYEASTGIMVTELDKARDTETAYRLSWKNATAYEKVYSIVAAYYNGETLVSEKVIKEIKMAPNTDAIATGVIKPEEGQSVRLYVRNDSQPEPEIIVPGTETGKETDPGTDVDPDKKGDMTVIIIAAAVALLVVAGVVVLLIVKKNKKAAAPVAEEAEATENPEEPTEE